MKLVLRKFWDGLKFIGRWLGPALILLALYFILIPLSPYGDGSSGPALVGAILSAIALLVGRKQGWTHSRKMLAACALAGLAWWGFGKWENQRGYHTETVSFDNRGAHLVGTLYLPDRPGKMPGIVFVQGSGNLKRSSQASTVIHYVQAGYAVLLVDKRGVGDSTGHFEFNKAIAPDNLDLLASDMSAALTLLAKRPEVRADTVGFVGVSQAGWIMPRAAVMNGHAAFIVSLSGPATSTLSQMRYEVFHIGEQTEFSVSATYNAFTRGNIPAGMSPDQADVVAQRTIKTDFGFAETDPAADLRKLDIPALYLLGDKDWMVPSGPTARIIEGLRAEGKPFEVRHIPGGWHGMMIAPPKLVWQAIDPWLARVTAEKHR